MAVERRGPFWDMIEGRLPAPPAARLLGWKLEHPRVIPFKPLRSSA